jgi:hypothetical protein
MATLSPEERAIVVRGVELLATADITSQTAAVLPAAAKPTERTLT